MHVHAYVISENPLMPLIWCQIPKELLLNECGVSLHIVIKALISFLFYTNYFYFLRRAAHSYLKINRLISLGFFRSMKLPANPIASPTQLLPPT